MFSRLANADDVVMTHLTRCELVLIRGLPGSGKTTMAKVLAAIGYDHYEADQYFERDGEYKFDPAHLLRAHDWCWRRSVESISAGRSCVVANTFSRRWEMQSYVDSAARINVPVRIIVAEGRWKSVHGVPAETIERMRARWEA